MNRADAARKVRSLTALADDQGASPAEKEQAAAMAARLRDKHGVTDEDLELAEPFVFFGHDLHFWQREVDPHLQRAAEEIDKAVAAAAQAPLARDRVEGFVRIHQAVKHAAEETGYSPFMRIANPRGWQDGDGEWHQTKDGLRLKTRRNEAIKVYFQQEAEEQLALARSLHADFHTDGEEPFDVEYQTRRAKDMAIFHTALATDMRQDVIERIVGYKREYS